MALTLIRIWRVQARISYATFLTRSRLNLCKHCRGVAVTSPSSGENVWRPQVNTVKKTEKRERVPNEKARSGLDKRLKTAESVKELVHLYQTLEEDVITTDRVKFLFCMGRVSSTLELDGQKRSLDTKKNLEFVLEDIRGCSSDCNHRQLADIVWAMAKLGIGEKRYFGHYEREISRRDLRLFSNIDLAMILWGYGKMRVSAPYLYTAMRQEVMRRDLSSFNLFELCQIVWSFVRTMEQSAKLFALIKKELIKRDNFKTLNNKGLIMLLWAYAESQLNVTSLFQVLKWEILRRNVSSFNQEQLAQIVWSFANQGMRVPDLFDEAEKWITTGNTVVLDKQGLVMVCWAFAKTKNPSEMIYQHVEGRLMRMELREFSAPQQVRLLWSFTRSGKLKKRLLGRLSEAILLQNLTEFPQGPLEELVDSLKNCPFTAPELVAATEKELMRRSRSGQVTVCTSG